MKTQFDDPKYLECAKSDQYSSFYAENDGGVHFDQKFVSGSVGASKVVLKEKYNKNPPNSINNPDNPNRNPPNSINNKYF